MRNSILKSMFLIGFICIAVSTSAQYLSMSEERPKIDKNSRLLFQVSVNQEASSNLNFKIVINNPGQELLNVNLKNQNGQLFQDDTFHRRPNYSMLLDLERLEDGIYTLSITTNYESFSKNFVITTEELGTRNGQKHLDRKVEVVSNK